MTNKLSSKSAPLVLTLELLNPYADEEDRKILMQYADANARGTLTRTLIVPEDMTLHGLHYAIQRLFGWQNSHLRAFHMDACDFMRLTEDRVSKWSVLAGILFKGIPDDQDDQFWDDEYQTGNFKVWLKQRYTVPYRHGGYSENFDVAQQYIRNLFERFPVIDVKESFHEYNERTKDEPEGEKAPLRVLKTAPIMDLTLEELNSAIYFDTAFDDLMERLEIREVLGAEGGALSNYTELLESKLTGRHRKPVTNTLLYNYDYGDDWHIEIKRLDSPSVLVDLEITDPFTLQNVLDTVIKKRRPVCVHKEGGYVMDDVGGMSGFADFLRILHFGEDKGEKKLLKLWAKGMGWSAKEIEPGKML